MFLRWMEAFHQKQKRRNCLPCGICRSPSSPWPPSLLHCPSSRADAYKTHPPSKPQKPKQGTEEVSGDSKMVGEIVVIPFPHPGHIFPAIELCRQLAERNYSVTVFLPSTSSPSSLSLHPLIQTVEFFVPHPTRFPPHLLEDTIPNLLAQRFGGREHPNIPLCAVVDDMISWLIEICAQIKIPGVSFFTSSATSAAIEHATRNIEPGTDGVLNIPGLPGEIVLTASDLPPRPPPRREGGGGPRHPRGVAGSSRAAALLINTCDDLEGPFIEYVARAAGRPAWGVGPLLPAAFWGSAAVRDGEVRSRRESSVSEGEVLAWLDTQPRGSVIYVAFGSLVAPTDEELVELAAGLAESGRPFIWVVPTEPMAHGPPGEPVRARAYTAEELGRRAGGKGMVVPGWAPQLMILAHPATGGYVCHCGWNSTVEALGCGVPVLAWPVRGDQFHNAKLITAQLGAGYPVRGADGAAVTKADVMQGIERVLTDEVIRHRAASARAIFAAGLPRSSSASLGAFLDFFSADRRVN